MGTLDTGGVYPSERRIRRRACTQCAYGRNFGQAAGNCGRPPLDARRDHRGSPGISGAWTTIRVEMHDAPPPDLILYVREGCHLCAEARISITLLLSERASTGRPTPRLVERDIESDPAWQRAYFATIPVIELGDRRVELVTSVAKMHRLLTDVLGA